MFGCRRARGFVATPLLLLLIGCGSGPSPPPAATATPLPPGTLQRLYLEAAGRYDRAEVPVEQAEYAHCTGGAPGADLNECEQALSNDRQDTLTFDNAIRNLSFPIAARADVARLLSDDATLETLLEQAATAPSLRVIQSLSNQVFALITTTTADAEQLRKDLGLPAASPAVSPSP